MEYFENMYKIEELWKQCRDKEFKDKKLNDLLFQTCNEGRMLFWGSLVPEWDVYDSNCPLPSKVASYERAIMLLEKEEKYQVALNLVNDAIEKEIPTDWYKKRKAKLEKLIK